LNGTLHSTELQGHSPWASEGTASHHHLRSPMLAITNLPGLRITACNPCHRRKARRTAEPVWHLDSVCCVAQQKLSSPKTENPVKKLGVRQTSLLRHYDFRLESASQFPFYCKISLAFVPLTDGSLSGYSLCTYVLCNCKCQIDLFEIKYFFSGLIARSFM
jgi:hypothetical protein